MAAGPNKTYLDVGTDGRITQKIATTSQTANSIMMTDTNGRLATAQLPVGVGPEIITLLSGAKINNGDFVNLYAVGAVMHARPADASNNFPAHGFVLIGVSGAEQSVDVYSISQTNNTATSADAGGTLTPGSEYYLSTTAGKVTVTPPTGTGQLVQFIGVATTNNTILFAGGTVIKLA